LTKNPITILLFHQPAVNTITWWIHISWELRYWHQNVYVIQCCECDYSKSEILLCCWFLDYIHTPYYISSNENGKESAAGKTGEDIMWKMIVYLPMGLLGSLRLTLGIGIPFIPLFLGWSWVCGFQRALSCAQQNWVYEAKYPGFLQVMTMWYFWHCVQRFWLTSSGRKHVWE
jgi:hypothetical protein